MPRDFLTRLRVEGLRGINNEGDPLDLKFTKDAVNSVLRSTRMEKARSSMRCPTPLKAPFRVFRSFRHRSGPKLRRRVMTSTASDG